MLRPEVIKDALLPAFGQFVCRVKVLREKAVFVRDSDEIQHIDNHVEVGHQNYLCNVGCKLVVMLYYASPQPGCDFAQALAVQLAHMETKFHALIELVSLEFPD